MNTHKSHEAFKAAHTLYLRQCARSRNGSAPQTQVEQKTKEVPKHPHQDKSSSCNQYSWSGALSWILKAMYFYIPIWILSAMLLLNVICNYTLFTVVSANKHGAVSMFGNNIHVLERIMTTEQHITVLNASMLGEDQPKTNCTELKELCFEKMQKENNRCIQNKNHKNKSDCMVTLKNITDWTNDDCFKRSEMITAKFAMLKKATTYEIENILNNVVHSILVIVSHFAVHSNLNGESIFHFFILVCMVTAKEVFGLPVVEVVMASLSSKDWLDFFQNGLKLSWTRVFQQDTPYDTLMLYGLSFVLSSVLMKSLKAVNYSVDMLISLKNILLRRDNMESKNSSSTTDERVEFVDWLIASVFNVWAVYLPVWWTLRIWYMQPMIAAISRLDDLDGKLFFFRTLLLNLPRIVHFCQHFKNNFEKMESTDIIKFTGWVTHYVFFNFFVIIPMENKIINLIQMSELEYALQK
jgi:hypothetical protein